MKKTLLLLLILITCAGCATVPQKPVRPYRPLFYPALPQQPRIQFLHSISAANDLGKKPSAFERFLVGKPRYKELGRPYDVAASKGKIYVMDKMYNKIVILDLVHRKMSFLDDHGAGTLGDPSGIWVSKDDVKYVADMQRKQIVVYGKNNNFLRTYGTKGMFKKPVAVAVYKNRVYVVDINRAQLLILNKTTGKLIKAVGKKGEFFKPTDVTVGPSGDVYVNDAFDFVIKKFSPEGKFLKTFGFHGDRLGGFARPKGVAVDKKGRLYVVDAAFENVQIFNPKGQLLLFFGGPGGGPGNLYLPAGIAIDYQNVKYFQKYADPDFKLKYLIYVVNMFGAHKLNVYGYGHWIGKSLPGE